MQHEQKGKIKNLTGFFAQFNGKDCTVTANKGTSGQTTLVNMDGGKGLFITENEFEPTK